MTFKHLLELDSKKAIHLIVKRFAIWIFPALFIIGLVNSNLPLMIVVPACLFLAFVSGVGLHNLGLLGHEGTHFSLHADRYRSAHLGVMASSCIPGHFDMGFAVFHGDHHRFTNSDKDPDVELFQPYTTVWSRLLNARLAASRKYFLKAFRMAFVESEPKGINLPSGQIKRLSRLNFLCSFAMTGFYLTLTWVYPLSMVFGFWIPYLITVYLSGLRPYLEHAGTGVGRSSDSRSWVSQSFDFVFGGINYHMAHHFYPAAPTYNIRELHEALVAEGIISGQAPIVTRWGDLLPILNQHSYGKGVN
jgi:fatty acid desaturase